MISQKYYYLKKKVGKLPTFYHKHNIIETENCKLFGVLYYKPELS